MDVQQLTFLYNKEEKDAAVFKLRETITEDRDAAFDKQSIFRAARAVVSVIIGVSQDNGAYAKMVIDAAQEMLFGPDPQKVEADLGENIKAAVGMMRADHSPGGWTALRFLAACAAAPNRDPNSPKKHRRQAVSLKGSPPPLYSENLQFHSRLFVQFLPMVSHFSLTFFAPQDSAI